MSIKNGFHYDDYHRRYYRDEQGDKFQKIFVYVMLTDRESAVAIVQAGRIKL